MTSLPKSVSEFLSFFDAEINAQPVLSATDLGRVGIERHQGRSPLVREQSSVGVLRLTGEGVTGHEAGLEHVSSLGLAFQKLITALGASLSGTKNLRGRIPGEIASRTVLQLTASPRPGSLILDLAPRLSPIAELRGQGELFSDGDEQLIDKAIARLETLIATSTTGHPASDAEALSSELRSLGPRAASALKTFVESAVSGDFDLDFHWDLPLRARIGFDLKRPHSVWINDLIEGRHLDAEDAVLHGIIRTVSHGKKWELVDSEFGTIRLDVTQLEGRPWSDWNPDDLVEVDASVSIRQTPGAPPIRSFVATEIRRWAGALEDIHPAPEDFDDGYGEPPVFST